MSAARITKATDAEKAAYADTKPVYPLYGFIMLGTQRCAIEDLRRSWTRPDPVYEIMAPKGFHFEYEGTHSLLCTSLDDVRDRLRGERLTPCTDDCV